MRTGLAIAAGSILLWTGRASAEEQPDLSNLSIEQLAQIKVTSASKQAEPLSEAPAALYVIDHDQIVRSGALTIPEILRLAPNLQVYQQSPSHWAVTARGLNGFDPGQSFSNKLLVLIDGRTVYTPLFSGVYWDLPDLLPDDIDRIEVISGPGATLWGANAVNGVINIITRSGASTASGAYAEAEAGTGEQVAGLRLAGETSANLAYRAYVRWLHEDAFDLQGGGSAHDGWHRLGGGFRLDWTPSAQDLVTFQGDIFGGREDHLTGPSEEIAGHNLVVRWNRDIAADQKLQVQAFYDRIARGRTANSPSFHIDTYDIDLQHSFSLGSRNQIVWGGGARVANYNINAIDGFFFDPSSRNLILANIFAQDTAALTRAIDLTVGIKAERDPYVGTSLLPDVRLAVRSSKSTMLWAAVSRAVRSATPFDEDARESALGGLLTLSGNRDFRTEKLTAYQLGVRSQPASTLSFSVTAFYNQYDDLRTLELGPGPGLINIIWGNNLAGHSYGMEAWGNFSPLSWWTLSAGAMLLREDFHFNSSATFPSFGTWQNGVDPRHQFTLQSSMDLGSLARLELDLRSVGRLQHGDTPGYTELGGRLAWDVARHLELSLTGANLLHAQHVEYPGGDEIERKVLVGLEWRP